VHELCYDGMTNELDDEVQPVPAAPSTPAATRVPGGRSPQGSPAGGAPESHKVGRVSDVEGWEGVAQPRCSVCNKKTTRCCWRCSRLTAGNIFPVCNPSKTRCSAAHAADPLSPRHKHRVSTGAMGQRKRDGKRPAGARPASTRPPPPKRNTPGSRSGGSAAFDPRHFQPRLQEIDDEEDEEDEERRRTTRRRAKTTERSLGSSITWAGDAAAGAGEGRSML
jgi:hypothetical protein